MDVHENNDYLAHYGVKGMKWGVRRYQNEDGTLTAEGKKRQKESDKSEKKSTHRTLLENKYENEGMTSAQAKTKADKRIKVEKAIAVAAGLTVAAAAVYVARNRWVVKHCDTILKAGTKFHNLDSLANPRPGEHLYVNYRQNDINFFRGQFALGKMKRSETGNAFNHVIEATDDIKIPSLDTRKSVFKQLYDSDKQFRDALHDNLPNYQKKILNAGKTRFDADDMYGQMWPRFGNKDDEAFNVARRKYFEALQQKGYGAIVDEWDTKKFVYRADAPLILLNTSHGSLGKMTISELSARDVLYAQANSKWYKPTRDAKNLAGLPHTNHFKESEKHLARAAEKSSKNKQYVDKALDELSNPANFNVFKQPNERDLALNMRGAHLADVGKLLTKNEKMTYNQAENLVKKKEAVLDAAETVGYTSAFMAPIVGISYAQQRSIVNDYIEKHPNTQLTYDEILEMQLNGRR